jgi:hypothetical protein
VDAAAASTQTLRRNVANPFSSPGRTRQALFTSRDTDFASAKGAPCGEFLLNHHGEGGN